MNINLNVKIKGGKRTQLQVDVYSSSVNPKLLELPNGKTISEQKIADWIEKELLKALKVLTTEQARSADSR